MNTWTDSGMSEAGLVGAMLALGLDTAPRRAAAPAAQDVDRLPVDVAARWSGGAPAGRGRFPAPDRSGHRPSSYPMPPLPEPKLASDDLSGWTDGFLAGGSPLSAPASWDEPSDLDSPLLSSLAERTVPPPAETTSMLDCLLDPARAGRVGRAPGGQERGAPVAPAAAAPTVASVGPEARPADAPASGTGADAAWSAAAEPSGPPPVPAASATDRVQATAPDSPPPGYGPLDGPLDVAELEPAQLDFELAPLDPDNLVPTLLEPTLGDRPAEEPSLAELTGLDSPGLGPVVLGSLGLESMDLDASAFTASPEYPPPTEPAATAAPAAPAAGPTAADANPDVIPGAAPGGAGAAEEPQDAPGSAHRRAAGAGRRASGGAHHRRDDDEAPLSSLDESPLYRSLARREH